MHSARVAAAILTMWAAAGLGGCETVESLQIRYGPDPGFPVKDVNDTLKRQSDFVNALIGYTYPALNPPVKGTDPVPAVPVVQPPGSDEGYWTPVALTGLNYVDEKCDDYLRALEILQRDKERNNGLVSDTKTLTTAVMTATKAVAGLQYVSAALGFVGSLNDTITGSYLFAQNAGVIHDKVKGLMALYRSNLATEPMAISSRPQAVRVVRNYLDICMRQTIEAYITQAIVTSGIALDEPGAHLPKRRRARPVATGPSMAVEARPAVGPPAAR